MQQLGPHSSTEGGAVCREEHWPCCSLPTFAEKSAEAVAASVAEGSSTQDQTAPCGAQQRQQKVRRNVLWNTQLRKHAAGAVRCAASTQRKSAACAHASSAAPRMPLHAPALWSTGAAATVPMYLGIPRDAAARGCSAAPPCGQQRCRSSHQSCHGAAWAGHPWRLTPRNNRQALLGCKFHTERGH